MSNEIQFPSASGLIMYAVLRNPLGSVWNTSNNSFVTWSDADIADYALSMSEQGTSGYYTANFPSGAATPDEYPVAVYRQLGVAPAIGDVLLGTGAVDIATEFNPTELLQIIHGCTGTVWIVDPVNGNDSTGNGSWTSPFKTPLPTASGGTHAASAGDTVLICGQSCDLGSSSYVMVAGVTLAGMGMMATTIKSSLGGSGGGDCVAPASNCTIRDLTVQSTLTAASNAYAYPIGNGTSPHFSQLKFASDIARRPCAL